MLLSDKHNFIFIHIYKNAGTSITSALRPYACKMWHYYLHRIFKKGFNLEFFNPMPYPVHITTPKLIEMIGYNVFKSYYSFGVVRNPWDWNVSMYKYMLKNTKHFQHEWVKGFRDFDEYIRVRCNGEMFQQKNFLFSNDGEQLVDYILRFENLDDDFQHICRHLEIEAKLPHLNISNKTPYREYYTDETRDAVSKTFKEDIELFGYEF